ncbi:hypothetical protein [Amycolatopsis sp. NBC_01480]|uniref:hypothetical protein n=1 Tax=Amycolatopsis sp. NBC_01480 TaxID=2903562 RepID=UPI002E2CD6ED|nr:hypothetical protein [Amycolatopsis sp. NBC_01480]
MYDTTTGKVLYDLELAAEPEWSEKINDPGGWKITVPLDGGPRTVRVREWCVRWRFSVAVLRGGQVCQAGPIVAYTPDTSTPTMTLSGKGVWELLNRRLLHNAIYNPAAGGRLTDASADINLTDTLPDIAREIVNHAINMSFLLGSNLPIDLPALDPTQGTNVRNYHGYDMVTFGQRLQELTQVDGGPDVLFRPYLTVTGGARYIRHEMKVGKPYLVQPGVPMLFDYPSNLTDITLSGDGSNDANSAYVKGTGNESGSLYGYASDTSLVSLGWPLMDMVDSGHTSTPVQSTLDSWAVADVALYSNQPEQWQTTVLADTEPRLGSYSSGHYVNYAVKGHLWIKDGIYSWRLIGMSRTSSTPRDRVDHQIQAVRQS